MLKFDQSINHFIDQKSATGNFMFSNWKLNNLRKIQSSVTFWGKILWDGKVRTFYGKFFMGKSELCGKIFIVSRSKVTSSSDMLQVSCLDCIHVLLTQKLSFWMPCPGANTLSQGTAEAFILMSECGFTAADEWHFLYTKQNLIQVSGSL